MQAQVLIITAIEPEYNAVRQHLVNLNPAVHPKSGTQYEIGIGPNGVSVAILEIGAGNSGAGIETERAITFWNPDFVCFVGVAGGLKDVRLGDVVASSSVVGYEGGKAKDELLVREEHIPSSYSLEQLAKSIRRLDGWTRRIRSPTDEIPQCKVGKIAAGEKVVASTKSEAYRLISFHISDALAVDMEGLGFLKAAFQHQTKSMVIRGISDLIDGKAHADYKGYQEIASQNAAAFAFEMIARSFSENPQAAKITDLYWTKLEELAVSLYPTGPEERSIWERAGGDVSILTNADNRREMWRSALRELKKGGGGKSLTPRSLIEEMAKDYPNNQEIQEMKRVATFSRG
jgi:adenosylhomocysteine nucleosidase